MKPIPDNLLKMRIVDKYYRLLNTKHYTAELIFVSMQEYYDVKSKQDEAKHSKEMQVVCENVIELHDKINNLYHYGNKLIESINMLKEYSEISNDEIDESIENFKEYCKSNDIK